MKYILYGLPSWFSGRESACQCRRHRRLWFKPWVGKIPWKREWQPTLVFLLGESHGQRSLAGYFPYQRVRHNLMTEHQQSNKLLNQNKGTVYSEDNDYPVVAVWSLFVHLTWAQHPM